MTAPRFGAILGALALDGDAVWLARTLVTAMFLNYWIADEIYPYAR